MKKEKERKYFSYIERKMKDCKLPYGMQYLNLLSRIEEKAERMYGKPNLESFKIETFDGGGYFTFVTSAKDHKKALQNLIKSSTDYKNIVNKNKTLTIKVTKI